MKRFSKIVSRITLRPSAKHINTMSCACMSVGKSGCGAVVMSTGLNGGVPTTRIPLSSRSTVMPAARIFAATACRWSNVIPSR